MALVLSCSQDPIFFTIKEEPIPVKPRITGSPTNMVVFERSYPEGKVSIMYVASGDLHWYAKAGKGAGDPGWDSAEYRIPQPGGKVIGLAATSDHLYALCIIGSGVTTVLRRIGPAENGWNDIGNAKGTYTLIQSVFADKGSGRLFAGAMNDSGSDYGILYIDKAATALELLQGETGMLSGAASLDGFHYLSTRGKGVYRAAADDISSVVQLDDLENPDGKNRMFMGMIQLNDNGPIIVIERNEGAFFEARESGLRQLKYSNGTAVAGASGKYATGALAVWTNNININNKSQKMLIAGIQGGLFSSTTSSSYSHGYVEIELDSTYYYDGGWLVLNSIRDINPDITVDGNRPRYTATIGKHPVNHFFQAPETIDDNMTFFASTQTAGLWSFRDRTGGLQWNAEGENEPKK